MVSSRLAEWVSRVVGAYAMTALTFLGGALAYRLTVGMGGTALAWVVTAHVSGSISLAGACCFDRFVAWYRRPFTKR